METSSFVKTLLAIDAVKEGNDTFRYKALALEMKVAKSRVSVLIDELEEEGYLSRSGPREVSLLPKGKKAIEEIKKDFASIIAAYSSSLSLPQERLEELSLITLYQGSSSLLHALTGLATAQ